VLRDVYRCVINDDAQVLQGAQCQAVDEEARGCICTEFQLDENEPPSSRLPPPTR
jgi:hypothetical protein